MIGHDEPHSGGEEAQFERKRTDIAAPAVGIWPRGRAKVSQILGTCGSEGAIAFDRRELSMILSVYGSKVAQGEWRDYAIDTGRDKAVFSVFRRTCEVPLYRIEKNPWQARKQGLYSVIAQGGMILRRGHDLGQVLRVLMRRPHLVTV
jgi:hypothetical protein